ncbi:Cytochrome P450 4d2 [Papilio machaon]|uniref:Cytochrome P450 4d2 n=1 Tax=Papilio machaon TaxID=76193 RepID=A0A194R5Z5_PAPMA|nr:Cytochrome P450 4d2 [Papilio machaon]
MFLYLVFIGIVLSMALFRLKRRRLHRLASEIPGSDDELPFIGVAHKFTGTTEDILTSLQKYSYEAMKKNGILRGWIGHMLYFIVMDPIDLEVVIKNCLEKDDLHRFLKNAIGNGGIYAPLPIWRRRRKIMMPAFSSKIVDTFIEIFSKQSEKLVSMLAKYAGKGDVTMEPFLSRYALDSICGTTMGIKLNVQNDPDNPFLKAMKNILNFVCKRIFHLWLQPEWLYKLFPQYTEEKKYLKEMHNFVDEVIQKKREEIIKEKYLKSEVDRSFDIRNYKTRSFLDLMITFSGDENAYNDLELREEIMTLTIAGTDTSAVSIGYTLKLLAMYPKVQDKLYQELLDVFGNFDRPIVKEDLAKLEYLNRVVKESLRLFPPTPFIIRKVLEDIYLPSGRTLPAGSGTVVSIWGLHRDPKYWGPKAEFFDPDRFLPERLDLKYSCSYMPFSSGPRNCPGSQYALMSIKTALSAIVRRYKIVGEESGPVPLIKSKIDIMLKAVDDYKISLEKRVSINSENFK